MNKILLSAGEVSGDMHAAKVVRSLIGRFPKCEIRGIAGPSMQSAGCVPIFPMSELNVMGIGDVVKAWPRIRRVEQGILRWAEIERPDVAILVDFPGFHMRLGKKLRSMDIPVLQYIAPKLWAWGSWRAGKLKNAQDSLACIFPFEPAWFRSKGIRAQYVGNPSSHACRRGWGAAELRQRLGLSESTPLVALLPGSRPGELMRHVPVLVESWKQVAAQRQDVHAVIPVAPGVDNSLLEPLLQAERVHRIERMSEGYALRADVAVAVSGTATLELALWNVPSILIYKGTPLMIALARRLVRLPYAGLANILLEEEAMPELIQEECTEESIVSHILDLLDVGGKSASTQRDKFKRLQAMLGDEDPAAGVVELAHALTSGQVFVDSRVS